MFRLKELLRKYKSGELDDLTAILIQNKIKLSAYDKMIKRKVRRYLAEKGIDVEFLEERERLEDFLEELEEERQSRKDRLLFGRRKRSRL